MSKPLDIHPVSTVAPEAWDLRSFGRRRGRKLSDRQSHLLTELLPGYIAAPQRIQALAGRPVWLEIGFGGGEHLLWQAENNPHVNVIGCEPFEEGIVKVLTGVADKGIKNLLLHPDDARLLLRALPDACIARAFVLFPDPWPKRKHRKRRLVAAPLLADLARILAHGAELRVATDIEDYARTMLMAFAAEPRFVWQATASVDWQNRPPDWPQTRYEAKAVREGRRSCYLRFRRI